MGYRHELKFLLAPDEAEYLAKRLRQTMQHDPNVGPDGKYLIRSLYFDTPFERGVEEKVSGVEFRDKLRIRIYNYSDKLIKFERKHKNGSLIKKDSIKLSRSQCDAILAGEYAFLLNRPEPFAKELYAALRTEHWRPKVLVDYTREPFVYPVEDVRLTFDSHVRTGLHNTELFNPRVPMIPATEYGDNCILEVKFNRYLPAYVRTLIQTDSSIHTAASKYLVCRQFDF